MGDIVNIARKLNITKVNIEVCNALGLDPAKVHSLTLKFGGGGPMVEVKFIPETKELVDVLRQYELLPKEDVI